MTKTRVDVGGWVLWIGGYQRLELMCLSSDILYMCTCIYKCVYTRAYICACSDVSPLSLQFDIMTPRNGATGGLRLYLRVTVEINETKARTRDGMRCFFVKRSVLERPYQAYVYAHQDTEVVSTTSLANRVASFRVLAAVKRRSWGMYRLSLALFPTILNWKGNVPRDCNVGRSWRKTWRFAE